MNDDRLSYVLSKSILRQCGIFTTLKIDRWETKTVLRMLSKATFYYYIEEFKEEFYSRIHITFDIKYNNIHTREMIRVIRGLLIIFYSVFLFLSLCFIVILIIFFAIFGYFLNNARFKCSTEIKRYYVENIEKYYKRNWDAVRTLRKLRIL